MKKFDDLKIEKIDIMLIDVEGREYETILGAKNKISQFKPIIILEIWDNKKRKFEKLSNTKEDILKFFEDIEYNFIKKINDNYIFFPKDLKL